MEPQEPQEYVFSLENLEEGTVTTRELKDLTAVDSTLDRVKHYVLHGWPRSPKGLEPRLAVFFDRRLELSLAHGLIDWGY